MYIGPFSAQAATIAIAATATASASVALPGKGSSIRIVNEGPNAAFFAVGAAAQTATLPSGTASTTSTPVLVGDFVYTIPQVPGATALQISFICRATQTAVISVQVAEGF